MPGLVNPVSLTAAYIIAMLVMSLWPSPLKPCTQRERLPRVAGAEDAIITPSAPFMVISLESEDREAASPTTTPLSSVVRRSLHSTILSIDELSAANLSDVSLGLVATEEAAAIEEATDLEKGIDPYPVDCSVVFIKEGAFVTLADNDEEDDNGCTQQVQWVTMPIVIMLSFND